MASGGLVEITSVARVIGGRCFFRHWWRGYEPGDGGGCILRLGGSGIRCFPTRLSALRTVFCEPSQLSLSQNPNQIRTLNCEGCATHHRRQMQIKTTVELGLGFEGRWWRLGDGRFSDTIVGATDLIFEWGDNFSRWGSGELAFCPDTIVGLPGGPKLGQRKKVENPRCEIDTWGSRFALLSNAKGKLGFALKFGGTYN
jgi:hypothetical protein